MSDIVPYATIGFVSGAINASIDNVFHGYYGLIPLCHASLVGAVSGYIYNLLGKNVIEKLVPNSLHEYKKPIIIGFALCGTITNIYYIFKYNKNSSNNTLINSIKNKNPLISLKINKSQYDIVHTDINTISDYNITPTDNTV